MLNPPIPLLGARCKRFIWYYKLGMITPKFAPQSGYIHGIIKRDFDTGFMKIHGILDGRVVHFGKPYDASIQLAMKCTGLKECLVHKTGEIVQYNDKLAAMYLDNYHLTKRPDRIKDCPRQCKAYAICRDRVMPKQTGHNMTGWIFNPELFEEFEYLGNGEYENFINGDESFAGKKCFSNEHLGQFSTLTELREWLRINT